MLHYSDLSMKQTSTINYLGYKNYVENVYCEYRFFMTEKYHKLTFL